MFRDEELDQPRQIFIENDISFDIFSSKKGQIQGKLGMTAEADKLIEEFKATDYRAIFFVGGGGAQEFVNHPQINKIVQTMTKQGKFVTAICMSPLILATAGVLQGKQATVFHSFNPDLEKLGVNLVNKSVVHDGQFLTGNGPQAATEFGQTLVKMLSEA
jgi:protease I